MPGVFICLFLTFTSVSISGCQRGNAPREFAPDGTVIEQAMHMELQQYYRDLSRTITAQPPTLKLNNIQVNQIDSFFLKRLPVYHMQGTYDLELGFRHQVENRKHNPFDLYLQRQTEGKTWRSLKKIPSGWQSYAIRE
ncbi:hypothetical protein [[Limnothrix rosea] IAM M-220]|uniref:hypothetical protein n=1 Tax=[Limnothrix rosea] IAM M-220 TaxID=454133 RepID=UPI000A0293F0|nr:hypothetical protein [[Limnothrix rosea] IAM M-220]